jgi:hypothetical protein
MSDTKYTVGVEVGMDASQARAEAKRLEGELRKLPAAAGMAGRAMAGVGKFASGGMGGFLTANLGSGGKFGGALMSDLKMLGGAFTWVASSAFKLLGFVKDLAFGGFKWLAYGAGVAAGAIYALKKAMEPAAEKQQDILRIGILTKRPKSAAATQEYLDQFGRKSGFADESIMSGFTSLQTSGLFNASNMRTLGDAAKALNRDFGEVADAVAKMANGKGELRAFTSMGISRAKLAGAGVQFDENEKMLTKPREAVQGLLRYFRSQYSGTMGKFFDTWNGQLHNMGGAVKNAFENAFMGFLPYATKALGKITGALDVVADKLNVIDWTAIGTGLVTAAGVASRLVNDMFDPEARKRHLGDAKKMAGIAGESLMELPGAIMRDVGATIQGFLGNFTAILGLFGNVLKSSFEFGASLFQELFDGIGQEFSDKFMLGFEAALASMGLGRLIGTTYQDKFDSGARIGAPGSRDYKRAMGWLAPIEKTESGRKMGDLTQSIEELTKFVGSNVISTKNVRQWGKDSWGKVTAGFGGTLVAQRIEEEKAAQAAEAEARKPRRLRYQERIGNYTITDDKTGKIQYKPLFAERSRYETPAEVQKRLDAAKAAKEKAAADQAKKQLTEAEKQTQLLGKLEQYMANMDAFFATA